MKLIYTHQNPIIVGLVKDMLTEEGVEVIMRNEYASGAVGELAPIDAWSEVWVPLDWCERAERILARLDTAHAESEWQCGQCAENNHSSFSVCWRCQTLRKEY